MITKYILSAAMKEYKSTMLKQTSDWLSIAKTAYVVGLAAFIPRGMTRAFINTRYVVMVYDNSPVTTGTAIRVMVQKHNDTPILNHWSEMQKIKNEIFGEETIAVEYYPAKSQLIDDHNIYWFWIFPENVLPIPLT